MATSNLYGLNYEYSHQNGKSIIFNGINKQDLTQKDLHAVQLKMMQSNKIPHLLSLSVENIDLSTKLHYDITSKSKLISFFRNNSANMNDYYQFFLSIIKTIEESSSYMLDQQSFVLDADFIFIGAHASDVYLTYLPIIGLNKERDLTDDMKNLLTDVAGEIEGLQGNEFKSILNYIKKPSFSFAGLKQLLLELISLRTNINQVNIQSAAHSDDHFNLPNTATQNQESIQHTPVRPPIKPEKQIGETKKNNVKNTKVKKEFPALTSREKTFMFVGAVLGIGMTWKLYDMYTNPMMLAVCGVLSFLVICAVVIYWKVWRPGVTAVETEIPIESANDTGSQESPIAPSQQKQLSNHQPVQAQTMQAPSPMHQHNAHNIFEAHRSEAASSMDTTLLGEPSEDTVLLEDEADLMMDQGQDTEQVLPVLIKENPSGQEEKIMIDKSNFLIGRNLDSVNYAEDAVGVSRIHAEIVKIDATSYAMKDLGSKNGSKLNSNAMVPYKIYALNENDILELGKATYTFTWSNSQ